MSYPSLLFTDKASGRRIETHVFEDVKLTAFFTDDSQGAMRVLCTPGDIPVRQDLLRYLDGNPAVRDILSRLSAITVELLRLHAALQEVKCENERHYVFVGLMAAAADFADLAASLPSPTRAACCSGALGNGSGQTARMKAGPVWRKKAGSAR